MPQNVRPLSGILDPDLVLLDVEAADFPSVCAHMVERLVARGCVPAERGDDMREALLARERVASTAIGYGVACPHAYAPFVEQPVVLFARLDEPLDLGAPDEAPTDLVFLLVGRGDGAAEDARRHLETLMQLSRVLQDSAFRAGLREADTPAQVLEVTAAAERRLAEHASPRAEVLSRQGLEARTGRFAGGVVDDLRRRLPHYLDDLRAGLHPRAFAAAVFLFFACFTAAVTFGGLMDQATGGAIGAFEMLAATALCGVIYALTSGQPLTVLGGTGPMLVFTAVLYQLCHRLELPFLSVYAWVGLWATLVLLVLALTDASVLIRYLTRFTDEIFVLLIAFIFVEEAVSNIAAEFRSPDIPYASAVSSLLLAALTLGVALALKQIRASRLLRAWARNFLADFGAVIAIAASTVLAMFMASTTELKHLAVPEGASLDLAGRLAHLGGLGPATILALSLPGAFLATLVFFDQQITARVVNSPEFHLRKGPGYHLDLAVVSLLLALCSVVGFPWLVAATVRSLNHVRALSKGHAEDAEGGPKVVTDRVLENRLSGVGIHVLVGASLALVPVLELVPMASLYGIFLYMGLASLSSNQFFERLMLWIQDPALFPSTHYLRRVPRKIVHLYTVAQLAAFVLLWVVKVSVLAILFPVVLALLAPVRLLLGRWFEDRHLRVLDAEETPDEELDREAE